MKAPSPALRGGDTTRVVPPSHSHGAKGSAVESSRAAAVRRQVKTIATVIGASLVALVSGTPNAFNAEAGAWYRADQPQSVRGQVTLLAHWFACSCAPCRRDPDVDRGFHAVHVHNDGAGRGGTLCQPPWCVGLPPLPVRDMGRVAHAGHPWRALPQLECCPTPTARL